MSEKTIACDSFVSALEYLMKETFVGSPVGEGSAYLDRRVGVVLTLGEISAADASMEINGTTIAAQTEHSKFYLDRLCEFLRGRTERVDWEQSWLIEEVNDAEWDALRDAVVASYERTLVCLSEDREWGKDQIGEALGMLAHTAYHLGGIRQLMKATNAVRASEEL
jgi:hypothetical protein